MQLHSEDIFLSGFSAAYIEPSRLLFPLRAYSVGLKYTADVFSSTDLNPMILVCFVGNTFHVSHQRECACVSVTLAAGLKNTATNGLFRCNVGKQGRTGVQIKGKVIL